MQTIQAIDPSTAQGRTAELFTGVEKRLGRVPNMLRLLGNSPAVLEAYLGFTNAFERTKIGTRLRALMTATIAEITGGDYIMAFTYVLASREGVTEAELVEARAGESEDPRTRAALQFAGEVVRKGGHVPETSVRALQLAGYGDEEIVEMLGFIGLSVFRNYFNLVAGTAVDFPPVTPSASGGRWQPATAKGE